MTSALFRYTCEFNITQYGDQSLDDEDLMSRRESLKDPRRDSVKDILNLGFTAHMESEVQPQLPSDRASAIRWEDCTKMCNKSTEY